MTCLLLIVSAVNAIRTSGANAWCFQNNTILDIVNNNDDDNI